MVETTLVDLGAQCLGNIFCLLTPQECGQLSVVSPALRALLLDEHIWQQHIQADFAQEEPKGPGDEAAGSFRQAYGLWAAAFGGELRPYVKRAVQAWRLIEGFLSVHLPEAKASLRPGASEQQIQQLEAKIGLKLPPALKVLYRLHDGQQLAFDETLARGCRDMPEEHMPSMTLGLFGGYKFYQHLTSVRMLPLSRVETYTVALQREGGRMAHCFGPLSMSHIVFATNAFDSGKYFKYFAVEAGSASIRVGAQDRPMLAAPELEGSSDGVLRWFEEYSRRLGACMYAVDAQADELDLDLSNATCRGVCLFPNRPPLTGSCVTRGVQVRASSVYVPEMSSCNPPHHTFAYSIRFSLLTPEQQLAVWPARAGLPRVLESCQLLARHWVVLNDKGERMDDREIRGEAVVGMYPLLRPGEPEFVYQSCTQQETTSGGMDGDFLFVEGSIRAPTGPEWEVICPRLQLVVPEYIF